MIQRNKEQLEKINKLVEKVDETINEVCDVVKERDVQQEAYTDIVKALAALVEARAKLV